MPRLIPNRLVSACALALVLSLSIVAGATAKGFSAELRVVGNGGKSLTQKSVTTGPASVKSSPRATCFGTGTGGSGDPVSLQANTAMGLLAKASQSTGSLKPLLISDSFDFGLALCGIGGHVAKSGASWYLKINHKAQSVGGDQAKIRPGDEVLWALAKATAPAFKYPNELALVAPGTAKAGQAFKVRVFSYDEKGKRKPAAGAKVSGGSAPTGADGSTMVTLAKPSRLTATKSGEIPSAALAVCVGGKCPAGK
jgi:hypothetical protein